MNLLKYIQSSIRFNGNFCIIGIDGPTASGKTTLADALTVALVAKHIPVFVYRLDWTLLPRENRLEQLDKYLNRQTAFEYEADEHMNLDLAADFLKKVEAYRFRNFSSEHIELNGLYNRDDAGRCTGNAEVDLLPRMVIIVEGHYTHHPKLRRFFDLNYLLVASPAELLRRKIARVGSYRDADRTTDYFNFVDRSSFRHYFVLNTAWFEHIFVNENFENQQRIGYEKALTLFKQDTTPSSQHEPKVPILGLIVDYHNRFVQVWGIHPQYRDAGFEENLSIILSKNQMHADFLNTYTHDSNHFSYVYGITDGDGLWLVSGTDKNLILVFQNQSTRKIWQVTCAPDATLSGSQVEEYDLTRVYKSRHYILGPNRLLIPGFLHDLKNCNRQYYQHSPAAMQYLPEFLTHSSFAVLRPETREEASFLSRFLSLSGFATQHINRYIFACNISGKALIDNFDRFCKAYGKFSLIHMEYPNPVDFELLKHSGCVCKDRELFFTVNTDFLQLGKIYPQLSTTAKKILTIAIRNSGPDIEIAPDVTARSYIDSLPATLEELYFALSVSGRQAIPFLSLYDLGISGLDVSAYFEYFSDNSAAFGLQASLNALGTKESPGYLQVSGAEAMAQSIRKQLIRFLQQHPHQRIPLWSLGVDHAMIQAEVNSNGHDFLKEAARNQWIKSYCIDLTAVFNKSLKPVAERFGEQLNRIFTEIPIFDSDIEIYLGDEKYFENIAPDAAASQYAEIIKSITQQLNPEKHSKQYLLGPWLGTLHHRLHNRLDPELSEKIRNACTPFGVLGNVLHGTSFTPYDSVGELVLHGCIRINFAGKFMFALVNGLPQPVRKSLGTSQSDIKKSLPGIQPEVANKAKAAVAESLWAELKLMLDSGVGFLMEESEQQWFRQSHYYLPDDDFTLIMNAMEKLRHRKKNNQKKATYLASMIEVPFGVFSSGLVKRLITTGITHFHIDIGDGEYISRSLDGFEKLTYLQKYFPHITTHLHLMVKKPFTGNGKSYVSRLAAIKQSLIYLHPEAYDNTYSWKYGVETIRQKDCIPGVVLTINEKVYTGALLEKMKQSDLHHLLIMGVPIGRGGQSFVPETIRKIEYVREWSASNQYEIVIEVDGGLSDSVINTCIDAGAQFLSGWSMFLKYGSSGIEKRVNELMNGQV